MTSAILVLVAALAQVDGAATFIVAPAAPPPAVAPAEPPQAVEKAPAGAIASESAATRGVAASRKIDFRGSAKLDERFKPIGAEFGSLEPGEAGLVAKVAGGAARLAAVGAQLSAPIIGDFQATLSYELARVDKPAVGAGAGVALEIVREDAEQRAIPPADGSIARVNTPDGGVLYTVDQLVYPQQGLPTPNHHVSPARADKGRLRIERSGGAVSYSTSEGESAGFTQVAKIDYPADKPLLVRFVATNGNSKAAVEAVFSDLAIGAEQAPAAAGASTLLLSGEEIAAAPSGIAGDKFEDRKLVFAAAEGRTAPFDEISVVRLGNAPATGDAKPADNNKDNQQPPQKQDAEKHNAEKKDGVEPKGAAAPRFVAQLDGDEAAQGELIAITNTAIRLQADYGEIEAPLAALRGVYSRQASPDDLAGFARSPREPEPVDVLFVRGKDGKLTEIKGAVDGLAEGKLRVNFEGALRSINVARLIGWVVAARPPARPSLRPYQLASLVDGSRFSGDLVSLADGRYGFKVAAARGGEALATSSIDARAIRQIEFRNGRMIYLSELKPVSIEEVGYFGRGVPHARDRDQGGGPLTIGGRQFAKGLAVQARTVLVYQLDEPFAEFRATLGFDSAAGPRGRARCRVLGDGRELFAAEDMRAGDNPIEIAAALDGVRRLTLEVDFGADEDVGDRLIWGDARIYRRL